MNTKQLTRGAMMCAIYGALLLINQQTALAIETTAAWIFVFPILIYTATSTASMGFLVALAMCFMTFLFGSFTTWFYSWTSVLIGYIYGIGVSKKWPNITNFSVSFIFSVIATALTVLVWTALFDMDLTLDFELLHKWAPFIDFRVFVCLFIVLTGFLQSLCIHMIALLICIRMHIEIRPLTPFYKMNSPKWVGHVSLLVWFIYFFGQNMVECSQNMTDIIQIIWIMDCGLLVYFGIIYLLDACMRYKRRKLASTVIMLAFIPGINFIWMIIGELDCLLQLRASRLEE